MKLSCIAESYEGLEDEDQFGEPSLGLCFACGNDVPEDTLGPWVCRRCDAVAHFSCAMPTREDIRKYDEERSGITSTGWAYGPHDPPNIMPGRPLRQNHNVMDGVRVLAATRAYDEYFCPDCAKEMLAESYEGLEDADTFEDDDVVFCDGCGVQYAFGNADLTLCERCGSKYCFRCIEGGELPDMVYDEDNGLLTRCAYCPSPLPSLRESYEGLEDADAFEEDEEDLPIDWRSVYTTRLNGVRGEINLLIDVNNPRRWEVMFDDGTIDERDLSFIQDLATWLGVQWSYRTSYEDLTARVKDKIYLKAYKDNKWHWPPQWGRLWEPPPGFPEPEPPNWYY